MSKCSIAAIAVMVALVGTWFAVFGRGGRAHAMPSLICPNPPCVVVTVPTPSPLPSLTHDPHGLQPGQGLLRSESITSENGCFTLAMQSDGNLVVYARGGKAIWSSGTNNTSAAFVVMQTDGNLVVYSPWRVPVWSSRTSGHNGARVFMQNDGNAVVYSGPQPIWATNSVRECDGSIRRPPVFGFADLHLHQFAYRGFGGRLMVGEAFGPIASALAPCDTLSDLHRTGWSPANLLEYFYNSVCPEPCTMLGHRGSGYPNFSTWPSFVNVTHQSAHQVMLKRAFDGGLRLIVMLAVNSKRLCEEKQLAPKQQCAEYLNIHSQLAEARAMEKYIAENDGGWYKIVYTPEEAREAIAGGKLAVVLGIEVSDIIEDLYPGSPAHDVEDGFVLDRASQLYEIGVRHVFPIHHSNNALGGASLAYRQVQRPAQSVGPDGQEIPFAAGSPLDHLTLLYKDFIVENCKAAGVDHAYGCNTRGLTDDGRLFTKALMSRGMVIDTDHMGRKTRETALSIADSYSYPAVASHAAFLDLSASADERSEEKQTQEQVKRIAKSGGILGLSFAAEELEDTKPFPRTGLHGQTVIQHNCGRSAESFAQKYLYAIDMVDGMPVAFGTDFNAMGRPSGPRFGTGVTGPGEIRLVDTGCFGGGNVDQGKPKVQYPFTALVTGKVMDRDVLGNRTYDINYDGVAHIGLLPDFVEELRVVGVTEDELAPLLNSAEGYIAMWEKAVAASSQIPAESLQCRPLRTKHRSNAKSLQDLTKPVLDGMGHPLPPAAQKTAVASNPKVAALRKEQAALACQMERLGCWVTYRSPGSVCPSP